MNILTIITFLVIISAGFSYLNVKFLKLPATIGVMTVSMVVSLLVLIPGKTDEGVSGGIRAMMHSIDFSKVLLDVMLGFLLFASALHFDFQKLRRYSCFLLRSFLGYLLSPGNSYIGAPRRCVT